MKISIQRYCKCVDVTKTLKFKIKLRVCKKENKNLKIIPRGKKWLKRLSWEMQSKIEEVSKELEKADLEVYPLFGNHDFIVINEFGDSKTTAANLLEKIHPIEE